MKRLFRASAFILLMASGLGLGVIGVRASTECERYIRVIAHQQPKHHKISSETAARWAAWNKAHPNYHPHKLTPKETWEKVAFACQVPVIEQTASLELPELVPPPPAELPLDLFPPESPNVVPTPDRPQPLPAQALLVPPAYVPQVPVLFAPQPPIPTVLTPTQTIGPTPEPGSFALMGTGLLSLAGLALRKRSTATQI
jgi:PEP-CTERM motif